MQDNDAFYTTMRANDAFGVFNQIDAEMKAKTRSSCMDEKIVVVKIKVVKCFDCGEEIDFNMRGL